jgi:hypothetical protein
VRDAEAETVLVTDTTRGHRDTGAPVGSLTVLDTRLLDDWGRRLAVVPHGGACDEAVCVYPAGARALALTATVREAHQVALHLICLAAGTAEPEPAP